MVPQAISFTGPGTGTVGGQATLTATGGASGNPVIFTVDGSSTAGACAVSGTDGATVTYTGTGTCVIDANQAAGNGYAAAPQVQQSITVSPGAQAISFTGPGTGTVGGQATLTATGGASGNPVTFTVDGSSTAGACAVSGTDGATVTYTGTGTCVIDANQAAGNGYAAAPQVQQSITVSPGAQAISFTGPGTGTVGGQATLTATGGASGNPVIFTVDGSSTAGACAVSGTDGATVTYTGTGTCVIDANQAAGNGYAAAPQVQQSITVSPGAQAISFTGPVPGTVGGQATLTATGGPSGNPVTFTVDPSSTAGACAVSGTDGATVTYTGTGTCVIDANQAAGNGYAAAPQVQQSITVSPGAQAPSFIADSPPLETAPGQPYGYTFAATGTPAPTYALAPGAPAWLTISPATGQLTGTPPAGTTTFTYTVTATSTVGTATAGPTPSPSPPPPPTRTSPSISPARPPSPPAPTAPAPSPSPTPGPPPPQGSPPRSCWRPSYRKCPAPAAAPRTPTRSPGPWPPSPPAPPPGSPSPSPPPGRAEPCSAASPNHRPLTPARATTTPPSRSPSPAPTPPAAPGSAADGRRTPGSPPGGSRRRRAPP